MKQYKPVFAMGSSVGNNPVKVWSTFSEALTEDVKEGYEPVGTLQLALSGNGIAVSLLMVRDVPEGV